MKKLETPILDGVSTPAELRDLDVDTLPGLAQDLRSEMIDAVSGIGG